MDDVWGGKGRERGNDSEKCLTVAPLITTHLMFQRHMSVRLPPHDASKVIAKFSTSIRNSLEVAVEEGGLDGWFVAGFVALFAFFVVLVFGEGDGGLEGVADLPAVPAAVVGAGFPVLFGEGFDLRVVDVHVAAGLAESV